MQLKIIMQETISEDWHGTITGYHRHKRESKEPVECLPCLEAQRQYWKQRRVDYNEHINTLRRAWRKRQRLSHNRSSVRNRARKYGVHVSYYTDQDVIDLYGSACHICNEEIDFSADRRTGFPGWEKSLHIDHVYPLSKGGTDTIENVRPAHGKCNILKAATVMSDEIVQDGRRPAYIFDVDGTLANVDPILHHIVNKGDDPDFKKHFERFHAASVTVNPNMNVVEMLRNAYYDKHDVIVVTAREEKWRPHTAAWLAKWNIPHHALFMRSNKDYRSDYEVKKDILKEINLMWKVMYAVDDNPKIIKLWEENNIPTTKIGTWDGEDRA